MADDNTLYQIRGLTLSTLGQVIRSKTGDPPSTLYSPAEMAQIIADQWPIEWIGTQSEYDNLSEYDENTRYYIIEEVVQET